VGPSACARSRRRGFTEEGIGLKINRDDSSGTNVRRADCCREFPVLLPGMVSPDYRITLILGLQYAQNGVMMGSQSDMIANSYHVSIPRRGDFLVDDRLIFEIGGKNKDFHQIKDLPDSFLAVDDIESGYGARIPLWLFGFLY
jgi:hypothetical protein